MNDRPKGMDPREATELIIRNYYQPDDIPPFDGMDDDQIIKMFYPLARAYLQAVSSLREEREKYRELVAEHARDAAESLRAVVAESRKAEEYRHNPLRLIGGEWTTANNSEGI